MITEVQIACIVLMGLITSFLIVFLPRYTIAGKKYDISRKILSLGTLLITIHFIIQYYLHKNEHDVAEIRSVINLLFGIPITYLVDLSYLYLLHEGNLKKIEKSFGPVALFLSLSLLLFDIFYNHEDSSKSVTLPLMAVIYATVLFFYGTALTIQYKKVTQAIKSGRSLILVPLLKWTQWSMFFMVIIAFGFPLMTFNTNLLMRSFYGILSISSAFFYILCFIGYGIIFDGKSEYSSKTIIDKGEDNKVNHSSLSQKKAEHMKITVQRFIESGYYLQPSITIKDVAVEMGISCNLLKIWLRTTEYEKFNNWIMFLRIEKAKEILLSGTELNSEEIAEKCGFCDRQYFQQQFRKHVGISPSKWAKEQLMSEITHNEVPTCKEDIKS